MSKERPVPIVDDHGEPVQEVFVPAVNQRVNIGSGTLRNSTDLTKMVVEVTPTADCVIAIGDDTVTAKSGEDYFIKANESKKLNVGENTRIATQAYTSGETGVLFIAEMG